MADKPAEQKTVELFVQLHTPELIKELLGVESFRTVRPKSPQILQLEVIELDMFEIYSYPNFFEFTDPRLVEHHLKWKEGLNEHEIDQLFTIATNFKVCNFDKKTRLYYPVIRSTKDVD